MIDSTITPTNVKRIVGIVGTFKLSSGSIISFPYDVYNSSRTYTFINVSNGSPTGVMIQTNQAVTAYYFTIQYVKNN